MQQCSCGKGPYCVHVLFVMLRVFQVKETDPMLWSRLKNYEVRDALNRKSKIEESRIMICTFGVVVYELLKYGNFDQSCVSSRLEKCKTATSSFL